MPARLSSLSRNRGEFTKHFEDGSSISVVYRPGRITPRQLHRAQALQERGDELSDAEQQSLMDEQTQLLADTLIAWDLLDDNGHPIPATLEGLQDVDYQAQGMILNWIVEDQQPGKASASGTSPGSSTPDSASPVPAQTISTSHPSPTGTHSKKRRSGLA